jgi:hypothetical protein
VTRRRGRAVSYGGQSAVLSSRVVFGSVLLLGIATYLVVLSLGSGGYRLFGLGLASFVVVAVVSTVYLFARRITLDPSILRVPVRFGRKKIPVGDVAGVGLLYAQCTQSSLGLRFSGWYVAFWRSDGTQIVCTTALVDLDRTRRRSLPRHPLRFKPRTLDVNTVAQLVSDVDPLRVASTRAAMIVRDISARVLALQGPDGPLAAMQLQRTVTWAMSDPTPLIAYWSPDGQLGPARWASEREHPLDPPVGWATSNQRGS